MDFLEDIKRETIIICDNNFKNKALGMNRLINAKFMMMEEFIEKYCFSYDESSILYVMDKHQVSYDIAKMYIQNLYYIENKLYHNEKLDFLVSLKKELDDNHLLFYNDNFQTYVSRTDIIIYNIRMDDYLKRIFKNIKYKIINRKYKKYEHHILSFSRMEEECEYVAHEICKLIDNGVDINNIKLTNIDKSYYNTIERIFSLHNLKVNIPYRAKLSSYKIVKDFINLYRDNDLEYAISMLDKTDEIYVKIITIINNYIKYNNKELIIYKLEHSYIDASKYLNGIDIIDYINYISDDSEYIFMLGFNDGLIPNSYRDIEYITDNIASLVGIDSIKFKNNYLRQIILNSIFDIKNLYITYKYRDIKRSYYPSTLSSYFQVLDGNTLYTTSYSEVYNKIKLMNRMDEYIKYSYISPDFYTLYNNFKIKYNSYNNKYTKIDRTMDKLTLSYSKMQIYNKCAFRYYLSEILKLNIFLENFSTVIGDMVHYVMENCLFDNSMDIEKYAKKFLENKEFSKKEWFFLDKYKERLKELLDQVLLEREYSLFNQAMYEKKIEIDYGNNIKFVGIIDKVLYYIDNNTTYISLIDYKTGNDPISLKYLKYGIDIQLPIYLYLSSYLNFTNPIYVGFYLQKFNINDRDYRLVGYSNSSKDILAIADKRYDNSKIIKNMKTNKDGNFSRYANVLSSNEIDLIKETAKAEIKKVINKIRNNEFDINPKVIDKINRGCEYCKFCDICNRTKEDLVIINTESEAE